MLITYTWFFWMMCWIWSFLSLLVQVIIIKQYFAILSFRLRLWILHEVILHSYSNSFLLLRGCNILSSSCRCIVNGYSTFIIIIIRLSSLMMRLHFFLLNMFIWSNANIVNTHLIRFSLVYAGLIKLLLFLVRL